MNKILVPTDFSVVSANACRFARDFAAAYHVENIVLLNSYEIPMISEPSLPAIQVMDFDALHAASIAGLEKAKKDLDNLDGQVYIETKSILGGLDAGINDLCDEMNASLIVIGIFGGNELEERLIGSTATNLANHSKVPLIIVPPKTAFKPIETVVLACNFAKIDTNIPVAEIVEFLIRTKAKLLIVHVDEHRKKGEDLAAQQKILAELFSSFNPTFSIVENDDFVAGISAFADEHSAELIITLPKKHGFFDRLFGQNHMRHLAFHTHIPLMCIHAD